MCYHPSLAYTVRVAVVILLLGVAIVLSMPLLNGIIDKAYQVREEYLPELTRWRHNTQRVEQLPGFIETLYWSPDPRAARNSRLQAQVLIDSFAFDPASALASHAGITFLHLQALAGLRDSQRLRLSAMRNRANTLLQDLPTGSDEGVRHFLAASAQLAQIGTDWQLWHRRGQALQSSQAPPLQQALAPLLLDLEALHRLDIRAAHEYRQALEAQQELAAILNTDTALKTQQIARAVEREATLAHHYGMWLLLLLGLFTALTLLAFQRYLLRPILLCNAALEGLSREQHTVLPPPTLFHELDTISRSVRQYSDLTRQLQQANRELLQLSQRDGLTGLANRRYFDSVLLDEYARACRHGHNLCLIMLDVDHFKRINDTYGHLFGDDCLRRLAGVLAQYSRRAGDLAARYGGEEFALILPEMPLNEAWQVAEQIRQQTQALQLYSEQGERVALTISAGVASLPESGARDIEQLIEQADQALYKAKHSGRNRVEMASAAAPDLSRTAQTLTHN